MRGWVLRTPSDRALRDSSLEAETLLPLIGIGVIVLTAGLGTTWCIVAMHRRRSWTPTSGVIIGSETRVSTSSNAVSGTSQALTIEWHGTDGAMRRYTENFSITRRNVPVGKRVRLYVHPRNAHTATRALIAPGVLLGAAGIVVGTAFTTVSVLVTR